MLVCFSVPVLGNLFFLLIWLCIRWKYAFSPLLVFIAGWSSIWTYCPLGTEKEPDGGEVIKLLTYNTQDIAAMRDYDREQGNPVLNYLRNSDADIICLQEFTPGGKVKQKEVDQALDVYPYHVRVKGEGGSRLACYSRFPILSANTIDYKTESNASILYRLKVGSDTLVLINNHLESNKLDAHDKTMYNDMLKSPGEENLKMVGNTCFISWLK